jgi:hypothetical protein
MGYDMGIIRHKQYTLWLFPKLWKPWSILFMIYDVLPWVNDFINHEHWENHGGNW